MAISTCRKPGAEFIGTFRLVLVGCGCTVLAPQVVAQRLGNIAGAALAGVVYRCLGCAD